LGWNSEQTAAGIDEVGDHSLVVLRFLKAHSR
jgi:hypothetical protein